MHSHFTRALSALALIGALTLTGCTNPLDRVSEGLAENIVEKVIEGQTGVDVDINNGNTTIETEDGSFQVGENVTLPSDLPASVPLPEGKLISAVKSGDAWALTYTDVDKNAVEDLAARLTAAGFEEDFITGNDDQIIGTYIGHGLRAGYVWTRDGESTGLMFTINAS